MKPELSKYAKRFDVAWEAELGWVWLRPWMSIVGWQFLEPLVHMVLKSLENLLSKSIGEGAYRNYDMVVPWKNATWDDVWSEFVQWVIVLYMRRRLEEVCDKPMSRMAHAAACLDGLMRSGTELSLDTMVHLLQESCVNNW